MSGILPAKPASSFAHFGFDEQLLKVIRKVEYTAPMPIQAQVCVQFYINVYSSPCLEWKMMTIVIMSVFFEKLSFISLHKIMTLS